MVVPNLMEGFQLDKVQAEYVADIRLRNINKEYILKRTAETEQLERTSLTWPTSSPSPPGFRRRSSGSWRR